MILVVNWLLLVLVVAVFLGGVVLALWPGRDHAGPRWNTRVLLVFLRLAIAWHFFIEGMDKLSGANWTSEGYLREATGPLAPAFRNLAGDRLAERLAVNSDNSFPDELDRDWEAYLRAFQSYYGLNQEQADRAREVARQAKSDMADLLARRTKVVEKSSPYPPPLKAALTMPERLAEYETMKEKIHEQEAKLLLLFGSEAVEPWKSAKTVANKWRAGLQKDLLSVNKELKRALQNLILDIAGETLSAEDRVKIQDKLVKLRKDADAEHATVAKDNWDESDRIKDKWAERTAALYRDAFAEHERQNPDAAKNRSRLTSLVTVNILESRPKDKPGIEPLPFTVSRSLGRWNMLDWSDFLVKYGITAVGLLLLVGLFTRIACVAGAGYLLLFYLAMPALPGWPESPRVEGHYLFVNKNIIEMLALLVLASTQSGRWAGLDALGQVLNPFRPPRDR